MTRPTTAATRSPSRSQAPAIPLSVQIVAAMALGLALGLALGPSTRGLGELGKVVIGLIKAAAAPLLFLAIVDAVVRTEVGLRGAGRMLAIATANATVALGIGLAVSNAFQAGRHLPASAFAGAPAATPPTAQPIDFAKTASGLVPTSFFQPFVENNILMLVFLALLFGFGLRKTRSDAAARGERGPEALEAGVASALRVLETVLGWIIRLVPVAVFGVVAKAAGEHGLEPIRGLGAYVGIGLLGLALQALLTYQAWLVLYVGMPLRTFWREAREAVVYAAGANSSLATLPVTLKTLDRLGVSKEAATLGACVGTNLNNDGIILYEAMAMLFVAQAYGIELSFTQQVLASVSCLVAAAGIAGVPEAGFVSLSLVLATIGLPLELLPLLLTVDWIVARGRSVVNVLSDLLTSIILDRWDRRAPGAART